MKHFEWTPGQLEMLGTVSDQALADKLGINRSTIRIRRSKLGIKPFGNGGHDGCCYGGRTAYKWSEDSISRIGKIPDLALAKELGVTYAAVRYKRSQLGITTYTRTGIVASCKAEYNRLYAERYPEIMTEAGRRYRVLRKEHVYDYNRLRRINNPSQHTACVLKSRRIKAASRFQEGLKQFATLAKKLQANEKD